MTQLEKYTVLHKSKCQAAATTRDSDYFTDVQKCLNNLSQVHKLIHVTSREHIASTEIIAAENDLLRRKLQEKKAQMENLPKDINKLMDEEWRQLEAKQRQLELERQTLENQMEKKSVEELKKQIIQLRRGLEVKVTQLQVEVRLLEREKEQWKVKCNGLEKKLNVCLLIKC